LLLFPNRDYLFTKTFLASLISNLYPMLHFVYGQCQENINGEETVILNHRPSEEVKRGRTYKVKKDEK
jgi:hypothetical protein